jgi:hypothetical protein
MSTLHARPAFSGRKMVQSYYDQIDGILRVLRPYATLQVIARHLTMTGLKTPNGYEWDRKKVSTYLRNRTL